MYVIKCKCSCNKFLQEQIVTDKSEIDNKQSS